MSDTPRDEEFESIEEVWNVPCEICGEAQIVHSNSLCGSYTFEGKEAEE